MQQIIVTVDASDAAAYGTGALLRAERDGTEFTTVPLVAGRTIIDDRFGLDTSSYRTRYSTAVPTVSGDYSDYSPAQSATRSLITPADFAKRFRNSVPDDAVQSIIDGNEAAINERYGALGVPKVDIRLGERNGRFEYLSPRAGSVSLVRELYTDFLANQYVVLDGPTGIWPNVDYTKSDWMLHSDGYVLERLLTGTHPADHWEQRVEITYLPIDNTPQRIGCLVELCKLDIGHRPGSNMIRVGLRTEQFDHTRSYDEEREDILASLLPRLPFLA